MCSIFKSNSNEASRNRPIERVSITQKYYSSQKDNTKKMEVGNVGGDKPKQKYNTKTKYLDCFDENQRKSVKKYIKKHVEGEEPQQNSNQRRKYFVYFYLRYLVYGILTFILAKIGKQHSQRTMLRGVNKLNQKRQNNEDLVKSNILGSKGQNNEGRNSMTQTFNRKNQRILDSSAVKAICDNEGKCLDADLTTNTYFNETMCLR